MSRSVYKITHEVTGRVYIGSSNDPQRRYQAHLSALRNGKHPVEDMQMDFDEFGGSFNFEVIDTISDESENHKEYDHMVACRSNVRGKGYNYKDKNCKTEDPENKLLRLVSQSKDPEETMGACIEFVRGRIAKERAAEEKPKLTLADNEKELLLAIRKSKDPGQAMIIATGILVGYLQVIKEEKAVATSKIKED